ncbi:MAG: adenylate/guanylate cyclase domain-containing protein [Acidobacteria bacterium]|nr:adenylate/guanylate cyclase domain-containing protein [Acidobacteriota bacterium]MCB9396261.1 adenylate/guanylate cyclase domain-containing protein [Acidobacteriota bacterium]
MDLQNSGSRRLVAVMFCDIVGYSAKMDRDEAMAMRCVNSFEDLLGKYVPQFEGRLIKLLGDGSLSEFPTAAQAVNCAQELLRAISERNEALDEHDHFKVRVGIHLGEVLDKNGDIFGEAVNIAARIQTIAEPGTIALSEAVYAQVRNRMSLDGHLLEPTKLKNIAEKIRIFVIGASSSHHPLWRPHGRLNKVWRPLALVAAILIVGVLIWKWNFVTAFWSVAIGEPQPNHVGLLWVESAEDPQAQALVGTLTEEIDFSMSERLANHWINKDSMLDVFGSVGIDPSELEQLKRQPCAAAKEGGIAYAMTCKLLPAQLDTQKERGHWELRTSLVCTRTRTIVTAFSVQGDSPQELVQQLEPRIEKVIPNLF